MRKNNCELIRQELDELMLDEVCSSAVTHHLRECAGCREFQEQQTKLRRMVGGLGIVSAPPDFDFRLRARLANDVPSTFMSVYWPLARRGMVVAVVILAVATGGVLVRNAFDQPAPVENLAEKTQPEAPAVPKPSESVRPVEAIAPPPQIAVASQRRPAGNKNDRSLSRSTQRPALATRDSASLGASVISGVEPVSASAVFPIDASQQSFTVSFDDGRGNAKTISVPTISFGSQRIVQNSNQFAPKRVW
jgi:hypothetical protein